MSVVAYRKLRWGRQMLLSQNVSGLTDREIRRALNRQGHTVARRTLKRLPCEPGTRGTMRGRRVIITVPAVRSRGPLIPSTATSSPRLRSDAGGGLPHVQTWPGVVSITFVLDDFSRRIADWSAAAVKETVVVLDAREMALRRPDRDKRSVKAGKLRSSYEAPDQHDPESLEIPLPSTLVPSQLIHGLTVTFEGV